MFDFGNASEQQREAIATTDGPVLIIAGPGSGKTYTLVQRAIYLIEERGAKPEQILMATYTKKAAEELVTRITNELDARNKTIDISRMYIGTIHSICQRILNEFLEYTRLERGYRVLDTFDQNYLVFRNVYDKLKPIKNYGQIIDCTKDYWKQAKKICDYSNSLTEELVDIKRLAADEDPRLAALGNILRAYQKLLYENNLVDFTGQQLECYKLLKEHPDVLEKLQDRFLYLMIDEYQDTNYIQEQLIFMLGKKHDNICVVGDDDQGLYRFRGATIRNILEFPKKFSNKKCAVIKLEINYRSNSGIVDFCNKWISTTPGFSWGKFRYEKSIVSNRASLNSPTVIKVSGQNNLENWHANILALINKLEASGKLKNYNQIAFLFSSLKDPRVTELANFLEENGIKVYAPRSGMFFERDETQLLIGCLLLLFPKYAVHIKDQVRNLNKLYWDTKHELYQFYDQCMTKASEVANKPENIDLLHFLEAYGNIHKCLEGTTDYVYTDLIYQLFNFKPFSDILDTSASTDAFCLRPVRNLARLTKYIRKYERLHKISGFDSSPGLGITVSEEERKIDQDTRRLFDQYLWLLYTDRVNEEDDGIAEYAPNDCVSFLTIHQSKGMEFPIVFVGSLWEEPRKSYSDQIMITLESKSYTRSAFEPSTLTDLFDFWRKYYVAYSRAQDLLVLTCNEDNVTPGNCFATLYSTLPDSNSDKFNVQEFEFKELKKADIKKTLSLTSHISVYETCPLRYKFYKELAFEPTGEKSDTLGTIVHATIEDIHKAVLKGEKDDVTKETIEKWFINNYDSLTEDEFANLDKGQKEIALNQVLRYAETQRNTWDSIKHAEFDVTHSQADFPGYIIEGKIDLVKGKDNTVELMDFKSEQKPRSSIQLERHQRQLLLYAYLVKESLHYNVTQLHLYYTAEENGSPIVSFPCTKEAIEKTLDTFKSTANKILQKDFAHTTTNPKVCHTCDFRFYCKANSQTTAQESPGNTF